MPDICQYFNCSGEEKIKTGFRNLGDLSSTSAQNTECTECRLINTSKFNFEFPNRFVRNQIISLVYLNEGGCISSDDLNYLPFDQELL